MTKRVTQMNSTIYIWHVTCYTKKHERNDATNKRNDMMTQKTEQLLLEAAVWLENQTSSHTGLGIHDYEMIITTMERLYDGGLEGFIEDLANNDVY